MTFRLLRGQLVAALIIAFVGGTSAVGIVTIIMWIIERTLG